MRIKDVCIPDNFDRVDSPDPWWYGYSIGRWVDDYTFVVRMGALVAGKSNSEVQPHTFYSSWVTRTWCAERSEID